MSKTILNKKILAKKYISALYEQSKEEKAVAQIWSDFQFLTALIESDNKAHAIITNCNIPEKRKRQLVEIITNNANFSSLTERFLALLIDNNRLYILVDIIANFKLKIQHENNELEANIYSAVNLDKKQLEQIVGLLAQKFNKNIIAQNVIDKKILGGFAVRIGSKMIDCSLANKLNILENESQKLITLK